jgi:hypothetical protein
MAAKKGPNVLFCMPNRTKCILLVSEMNVQLHGLKSGFLSVLQSVRSPICPQVDKAAVRKACQHVVCGFCVGRIGHHASGDRGQPRDPLCRDRFHSVTFGWVASKRISVCLPSCVPRSMPCQIAACHGAQPCNYS